MILALVFLSLILWGYWLIFRDARTTQVATPLPAARRGTSGVTTALGLEDDPDQWRATRAWTALDECQLIRLLTDSAPTDGASTTNFIDDAVHSAEREDTP
jgi:hypothetical protein